MMQDVCNIYTREPREIWNPDLSGTLTDMAHQRSHKPSVRTLFILAIT